MKQDISQLAADTEQWAFVRNSKGRATNVRVLRGTTIIEVLHKGERMLVDTADFPPIAESVPAETVNT